MLGQKHLCNAQYMSIITFRRDVLQVGYSPLSLYYILLIDTHLVHSELTIHSNHNIVHQSCRPKSTCVHPCIRLTQRRKLQNTGVGLASGVAAAHNSCHSSHTRGKGGTESLVKVHQQVK